MAWDRDYVLIAYLSSQGRLRILHDYLSPFVRKNTLIPIQIHLHVRSPPILQVFQLPFLNAPLVLDKVTNILVLRRTLIPSLLEWYPTYLTYR